MNEELSQSENEITPVGETNPAENAVVQDEEAPDMTPVEQTVAPNEATTEAASGSAVCEPVSEATLPSETVPATESSDGEASPLALITADAMPLIQVVEALLFSTDMPLSAGKLAEICGLEFSKPVKQVIEELNASYEARQAAYRIEERAGGYQILTLPQYADYIERLVRKKDEGRLTPAMLEALAIVAYRQPIIRADVEAIRGVACGEVLRVLMEHNLIKIVGRAEILGRPMLYGTTRYFLEVFGLSNLKDLPKADQLKDPGKA